MITRQSLPPSALDPRKRWYGELLPQIAAINVRVIGLLDDVAVNALDDALSHLTVEAVRLNQEVLRELRADRRTECARHVRRWAEMDK